MSTPRPAISRGKAAGSQPCPQNSTRCRVQGLQDLQCFVCQTEAITKLPFARKLRKRKANPRVAVPPKLLFHCSRNHVARVHRNLSELAGIGVCEFHCKCHAPAGNIFGILPWHRWLVCLGFGSSGLGFYGFCVLGSMPLLFCVLSQAGILQMSSARRCARQNRWLTVGRISDSSIEPSVDDNKMPDDVWKYLAKAALPQL